MWVKQNSTEYLKQKHIKFAIHEIIAQIKGINGIELWFFHITQGMANIYCKVDCNKRFIIKYHIITKGGNSTHQKRRNKGVRKVDKLNRNKILHISLAISIIIWIISTVYRIPFKTFGLNKKMKLNCKL